MKYIIDIVGTCNLRCPSCGRRDGYEHKYAFKGLMKYELFLQCIDKIAKEGPDDELSLYDWGEPMMHPRIGDMVTEIKKRGMQVGISTNGNATKFLENALAAGPAMFGVSLSGFTKGTYEITHKGGDASTVIGTIIRAWEFIRRHKTGTRLIINFHLYRNNVDQLPLLKSLVDWLGCEYNVSIARLITLDDYRDSIEGKSLPIEDNLLITPKQFLEMSKGHTASCQQIDEDRVTILADGSVQLCCAVMGDKYKLFPSYLDITMEDFKQARDASPICTGCMQIGYHSPWDHLPVFKDMVNEELRKNGGAQYIEIVDTRLRGMENRLK